MLRTCLQSRIATMLRDPHDNMPTNLELTDAFNRLYAQDNIQLQTWSPIPPSPLLAISSVTAPTPDATPPTQNNIWRINDSTSFITPNATTRIIHLGYSAHGLPRSWNSTNTADLPLPTTLNHYEHLPTMPHSYMYSSASLSMSLQRPLQSSDSGSLLAALTLADNDP